MGPKKQAEAGPKIGEKFRKKVKKLPNFIEKKGLFRTKKKQAGAELKQKKRIFWAKNWEKIEYKDQKLTNLKKKKDFLGQNCGKNVVLVSKIDNFSHKS